MISMDLFGNTAVILNSVVSSNYYGMLREQISKYLPPEYPIIAIWKGITIQSGHCIAKSGCNEVLMKLIKYENFLSKFTSRGRIITI